MDHDSGRRVDRERSRVDNAVVGLDELDPEAPERYGRAKGDDLAEGRLHHAPLLKLILDNAHGQPCGEYRDVDLLKHIGQRADMVLVPVRDDKALDFVDVVLQISGVRDHQVDSEHVIFRKRQSAVHHNNTVFVFEGSDVHADLLQTSQRDDLETFRLYFLISLFLQILSSCISSTYSSIRIPISSSLSLNRRSTAESSLSSSTTA